MPDPALPLDFPPLLVAAEEMAREAHDLFGLLTWGVEDGWSELDDDAQATLVQVHARLLADLTRVEAERDLYASALPYVLRPLSGGGHSVWIAGGTDSHVGDVPPGLTTAEVHALAMLAVWARLDADEKRDREYVARVEEERDTARAEAAKMRQWAEMATAALPPKSGTNRAMRRAEAKRKLRGAHIPPETTDAE